MKWQILELPVTLASSLIRSTTSLCIPESSLLQIGLVPIQFIMRGYSRKRRVGSGTSLPVVDML